MNVKSGDDVLQILLVEDDPTDALLLKNTLGEVRGVTIVLTTVNRLDEALARLRSEFYDAVLLDLGLPDSSGVETFTRTQNQYPDVPILVLSGLDDDSLALTAVCVGAQDCVVKGKLDSIMLARTIRYAVERKRAAEHLARSELGYRRLFEAAQDGIFISDAETGKITEANPALETLLGYPAAEFIGKKLWETSPFSGEQANLAAMRTVQEKAYVCYDDLPLTARDGRIISVEFVSNVYGVGKKQVIQCNIRDITDRKQAQEERDHFFNISLDMLAIVDANGYLKRVNRAFVETLGFSEAELMASPFRDRVHPEDRAATQKAVDNLSRGVALNDLANRYRAKNGSWRWLEWRSVAVLEKGLIYAAARDVTERKEAEASLCRMRDELEARVQERTLELEQANAAKDEFLSRMSHELRTPLNAILGFGQILEMQSDLLSDLHNESVQQILKAGRHQLDLVNEVLDIARIQAPDSALSPEPVSLQQITREALDMLQSLADEAGISIVQETEKTPVILVLADRQRLLQILLNLVDNAIKYNRPGGRVTVCAELLPQSRARFHINDTGHGITPEGMSKLFIPFSRLNAPVLGVEGTGLGLALCKRLAEAMGGSLHVESKPGQGSAFSVELPLAHP